MPTAIVTGASRGLGLALTRALPRGLALVIDARGAEALDAAVAQLRGHRRGRRRHRPRATAGRSSRPREASSTCSSTTRALGPSPQPPLADYPLDVLEESSASTSSPRSRSSSSRCRTCPAGVVNVTSDAAVEPYEGWGGYGAAKAALEQLTSVLAAERPELRVYAVDPGDMRTRMHQVAFPGEDISDRPLPEDRSPGSSR